MRNIKLLLLGIVCLTACHTKQVDSKPASGNIRGRIAGEYSGIKEIATLDNHAGISTVNATIKKGNLWVKKNIDSASFYYRQALWLSEQIGYPEGRAITYNNLSYCYQQKKEDLRKNHYINKFKEELKNIPSPFYNPGSKGHQKLLAQKTMYKALDYYDSGNYDSASNAYIKTIKQIGSPDSFNYTVLAYTYIGLGAIAGHVSYWERATFYFDQAEKLAQQYKDSTLLVNVLGNKACLYQDQKDYAKALTTAQKAMDIAQRTNMYYSNLAQTIAACLLGMEKPQQALSYGNLALQNAIETKNQEGQISAYYVLGYNYVQLNQYQKAKNYLTKGLVLAGQTGKMDNIANALGQISRAYAHLGDYYKAYLFRTNYSIIRDSLMGEENAARIAVINAKYQVAKKDKELARRDQELTLAQLKVAQQQKRQYLWGGSILILLILIFALLRNRKNKMAIARMKATLEGEEKERTRLAMELHDGIVSRLSIIKMNFSALPQQYGNLNEAAGFQEVVEQLEQSITELRTTSHNLLPATLQRTGLAESLNIYCEKIRKIALLDIEFQLLGELPPLTDDFQLNIYRIIQELVNNIIKHSNASHALLQFQVEDDWLSITLDDNGSSTPNFSEQRSNGIGLQNLHERIHLLNGTIETESIKGTSVYLEFNLKRFIRKK